MQTITETSTPDSRLEALSAMIDGECPSDAQVSAVAAAYHDSGDVRAAWLSYQCIGEVLRNPAGPGPDTAFVSAVMGRIARETQPQVDEVPEVEPMPVPVAAVDLATQRGSASNDAVFRWKMVAGFASLVAVAAVAWQVAVAPTPQSGPQWAAAPANVQQAAVPVQAVVTERGVVLRDPQLEELMAAHRQYGGMSALQMPAGFLRNATYEPSQR